MVTGKILVMRQITRPVCIVQCHDEAWMSTSDTACRLDVFGVLLRLPRHDHESEPVNIHADCNHIRCDGCVYVILFGIMQLKLIELFRYFP